MDCDHFATSHSFAAPLETATVHAPEHHQCTYCTYDPNWEGSQLADTFSIPEQIFGTIVFITFVPRLCTIACTTKQVVIWVAARRTANRCSGKEGTHNNSEGLHGNLPAPAVGENQKHIEQIARYRYI